MASCLYTVKKGGVVEPVGESVLGKRLPLAIRCDPSSLEPQDEAKQCTKRWGKESKLQSKSAHNLFSLTKSITLILDLLNKALYEVS